MVISKRNGNLVLVAQTDHGALAGDFVASWGNDRFERPDPFEETQLAARMHDEGWRQADEQPLFNAPEQRPLNFLQIPLSEHMPLYKRGVDAVYEQDPYAGLLVGMHWTGLYRWRWGLMGPVPASKLPPGFADPSASAATVEEEEQRWVDVKRELVAGVRRGDFEARLWNNYELMQAWDVLSLFVCMNDLDEASSAFVIPTVPLGVGTETVNLTLRPRGGGVVTVDPYPFAEEHVRFEVVGRELEDRSYPTAEDLTFAYANADQVTLACEMTTSS